MVNFIDRERELGFLEERYKGDKFEFIPIYGRRRVGKTELIRHFIKGKPYIYFLSERTSEKDNLNKLKGKIAGFFKDELLEKAEVGWEDLFRYVKEKEKRIIIVIDEFPYLTELNMAISSIFQRIIDLEIKDSKIFLILCGSSIGMMEREVLLYRAPLYGRRTGQWLLEPFRFEDAVKFFPRYSMEDKVTAYGTLGGVPFYLGFFDDRLGILENLERNLLTKGSLLYEEPFFLIREELREPRNYLLILKAIALGYQTFGKIASYTGIAKNKLMRYLEILQDLRLVKRETPILAKPRTKIALYKIEDKFFNFWFRFVLKNKDDIEEGKTDKVLKEIRENLGDYIGKYVFEDVAEEFFWHLNIRGLLPFRFSEIGRWWTRGEEIDLVALSEDTGEIFFCEVKWKELSKNQSLKILKELKEKATLVKWHNKERKEHYGIIAKKLKDKKGVRGEGYLAYDLRDFQL